MGAVVIGNVAPPETPGTAREEYDPADSYEQGDPVWVWSLLSRTWCPGRVDAVRLSVLVRFEPTGQRGTAVDTVPPCYVARRQTPETAETSPPPG